MNYDTLARLSKGSEFAGFHQGKKFFGVKGTDLKGMKAAASVMFVVKKKNADGEEKKSIRYKSVFAKSDLRRRLLVIRFLTQIGK